MAGDGNERLGDPEAVLSSLENVPVEQSAAHYYVAVYYLSRGHLDEAEKHVEMAENMGQKVSGIDLLKILRRRIQDLQVN